jgi:serine O-acetyltransferase
MTNQEVWTTLQQEAEKVAAKELILSKVLTEFVLDRDSFADALGWRLASRLGRSSVPEKDLRELIRDAFLDDLQSLDKLCADVRAVRERDPACRDFLSPFLYFKGFQALAGFRVSNYLWRQNRRELAQYLQSLIAAVYAVDIHPAANVGKGILLDHATGFVAGETTVIEDNVSILHEVTLGGTGKERGDRHPKIRSGVLIGAGAKILGNVEIGEGARIGAGSVVLKDVPPHVSVAGVPAKELGKVHEASPALGMDHMLEDGQIEGGEAI